MKSILLFIAIFFTGIGSSDFCSPVRPMVSDMMENKADYDFVKGYFLPHDGSKTRLARFTILETTNDRFIKGDTYPVFEYGPFGSMCETYEMGASPLEEEFCGKTNERYLIVYKKRGDSERLVTPIFHAYGLTIDTVKDEISDQYAERASLSDFENYIIARPTAMPKWEKIAK